jgi:hypothetical protein
MKAAQMRSLPVQGLLVLGLFLGSTALAIGMVSQRWRFESHLKESYAPPKGELSDPAKKTMQAFSRDEPAVDLWAYLNDVERRAVYCDWFKNLAPDRIPEVRCWRETDEDYFVTCAERTAVCGNAEQRKIGLALLEGCSSARSEPALQRLAAWAAHACRSELLGAVQETQNRVANSRTAEKNGL